MNAHINADRDSKHVHTVGFTAANVSDIAKLANSSTGKKPRSMPSPTTPEWKSARKSRR